MSSAETSGTGEAGARGAAGTPGRARRRRLGVLAGAFIAALVLIHAVGGWFFAGEIHSGALAVDDDPDELRYDVEIVAVDDGSVTYQTSGSDNPYLEEPGTFGVAWQEGFGLVGDLEHLDGDTARRPVMVEVGHLQPGTKADLIGSVWPTDPESAHGIRYADATIATEIGGLDAWYVPGTSDAWVIVVHGKSTPRHESLRILPVVHKAGHHALVITYRGDPGVPPHPSGRYQYGLTEYRDVESAIGYALDHGAKRVALIGFSMGGALVAQTLLASPLASAVEAVVLDAPMLDLEAAIDLAARQSGVPIPGTLLDMAKWTAGWRYDIDWAALDVVARADELATPMLVFHGEQDDTVPISVSEDLAAARPDLVVLERFEDAGHVTSWNVDPERYERAAAAFLTRRLG